MPGDTTTLIMKSIHNELGDDAFKGFCVGNSIAGMVYVIDRFSCRIHVQGGDANQALASFKSHPARGFVTNQIHGATRFTFAFHIKPKIEMKLDEFNPNGRMNSQYAIGISAALSNYATAPLSVIKAMRFNGVNIPDILRMPCKYYFNGMNANALRDLHYFSTYFISQSVIATLVPYPFLRSGLSGLAGGTTSSPYVVIGNKQKVPKDMLDKPGLVPYQKSKNIFEIAKDIYRESGAKGFFPKFFLTSAPRVIMQGFAIEAGTEVAKKYSRL